MKCSICDQETSYNNIRLGVCWDCATVESIIADGTDMYDEPSEPVKTAREKVRLLISHGLLSYAAQHRVQADEKPATAKAGFSAKNILSCFAGLFSAFRR